MYVQYSCVYVCVVCTAGSRMAVPSQGGLCISKIKIKADEYEFVTYAGDLHLIWRVGEMILGN